MTLRALTDEIMKLPPEQVTELRDWLDEHADAAWDAALARDAAAGKLDRLAEQALADHAAGRTRPL